MKKRLVLYALLLLSSALFEGCDTRRHIHQDEWVSVEFSIDWGNLAKASKSGDVTPNGATVVFFPTSGILEEPMFKQTNYTSDKVNLPVGRYNVIVFNETINGHDYIQFRGIDNYDTIEAYWETTRVKTEYSRANNDEMILDTEDLLLVDRVEQFEITYINSDQGDVMKLNFLPVLVNRKMSVLAHIKGMVNTSRKTSSLLYIEGMALGYNLWSGAPTRDKSTHLMSLGNKTFYDGSTTDGTMSASFYTFGDAASETKADDDNIARLSFALRDGTTHPDIEINISDQLNSASDLREINVEIGTGDPEISLPDADDLEFVGSGMDAEVGDWGDDIIIDLPY